MAVKQIDLRNKIQTKIATSVKNFHYEPLAGKINESHFPVNTSLTMLTYLLDGNQLFAGDPGWGKTTLAKTMAAICTGVPYDLYDAVEMRGNPQKYEEKTIARPSYGALATGVEKVNWLGAIAMPVTMGDEINRFSQEMQDVLLQGVDTGSWSYLNASYSRGKKPMFATINYHDDGNGDLIPPLLDRMSIMTESGYNTSTYDYQKAKEMVKAILCDPNITNAALEALQSGKIEAFETHIAEHKLKSISPITLGEKEAIREQINAIPLAYLDAKMSKVVNNPLMFLYGYISEINYSDQWGFKRSVDSVAGENNHDVGHIGAMVKNSISPRTQQVIENYSKGLAWLLGSETVNIDHVKFILKHTTAHKLSFDEDNDNITKFLNERRAESSKLYMARRMVETAYDHYRNSAVATQNLLHNIMKYQQMLRGEQPAVPLEKVEAARLSKMNPAALQSEALKQIKALNPDDYDYPLAKEFIAQAKGLLVPSFGESVVISPTDKPGEYHYEEAF